MSKVTFGSTYRVPLKQVRGGVTPGRKDSLKELSQKWGGTAPSSRAGNVKFSVPKRYDGIIKNFLAANKFADYEVVDIHRVPQEQLLDALSYQGRFATKNPNNR